jgi:hypothetical protein
MQTPNEEFDLEKELGACKWILAKVKRSDCYRQNLYAALCNNEFQKIDTWNILKDKVWSCSWRYAGELVARLYGYGDYMDYYCSGMLTDVSSERAENTFVNESVITEEIAQDFKDLGWVCVTKDTNNF